MSKSKKKKPLHKRIKRTHLLITSASLLAIVGVSLTGWKNSCESISARLCFDKKTANKVEVLKKNASNPFDSCLVNAAPNDHGTFILKTKYCTQEKVSYCYDGTSNTYLRKFTGECETTPPPSPTPTPTPTATPTPTPSALKFRILSPNGGEQLPFGSYQVIRWEGGDTANQWPIYLSIIDKARNVVIREIAQGLPNSGSTEWIVDLPLGNYYIMYGQGCRGATCTSPSEWDQGDSSFTVVAGSSFGKVSSSYPANQSLVVLSPSGGETFSVGSAQNIKWSGGSGDSKISVSLIDVATWTTYSTLFTDLANDGEEAWTVPGFVPPGSYKMYVSCSNCGSFGNYNYSFYPFTIASQ